VWYHFVYHFFDNICYSLQLFFLKFIFDSILKYYPFVNTFKTIGNFNSVKSAKVEHLTEVEDLTQPTKVVSKRYYECEIGIKELFNIILLT